ncbi:hypothetical protein Vadar_001546 [Vaccinium darrowii]|uniref:Uncharacterized protein n=1 Tax=Vaccinium darrowii TaxID=229202 RepID=A0ACB7X6Z1_9ERIC|nr:hypothetical protein Vadar_001546 [Vaccinium darrowii]
MEGGGFGYGNLTNNPPSYKPCSSTTPPLTAIGRFLLGNNHFSNKNTQNNVQNEGSLISPCGFNGFSHFDGAIDHSYSSSTGFSWPSRPEMSFLDRLFVDGESLNLRNEGNPNLGLNEESNSVMGNCKGGGGKRGRGASFANLIKGQWTDEEDR